MNELYSILKNVAIPLLFTGTALYFSISGFSQCDVTTPSFVVDLSNNPDSIWIETNSTRLDSCCFQQDNDPCIMFIVTLPPNVGGLYFSVENPQPSISASQFRINCDTVSYSVQDTVCVAGYTPPYVITYCKPGNDKPDYIIAGIGSGEISPPITVSDACTDTIYGTGFKESTITWTSYPYNPVYQSFLSDTVAQDTVIVTPSGTYPDSLQYILCGELAGLNCSSGTMTKCDTTTVYFVTNFSVAIAPQNPAICFGGTPATLTANASGGAAPYSYLWNTGDTTQTINVSSGNAGLYWVEVRDTLDCAGVRDSVTVTEFTSAISAGAGPDLTSCANNTSVFLNGIIQAAAGGIWTGGNGIFSPDDTTLNAGYKPDSNEVAAGIATLYLTTTGNGSCPADTDTLIINISPGPVVDAGPDQTVCGNNPLAILNGSVSGGSSTGLWSSSGTGNFAPNDSTLNATYNLSGNDISSGTITLTLVSTNNGTCLQVSDSLQITVIPPTIADAGTDQVVCANNSITNLSGSVNGTSVTGVWTTNGNGSFSPNDSDLSAIYIPGSLDTSIGIVSIALTSTNNGGCNAVTDSMQVNFTESPTAYAGPDVTICADSSGISLNGTITIAGGGVWTTTGTGTFTPGDSILNTTYLPSAADTATGNLSFVLSSIGNGTCSVATDTMILSITDAPLVSAGNDQTVCANNAIVTLNGSVSVATGGIWTSSGSGNFSPDSVSLNTSYIPSASDTAAGNITLFITSTGNGSCNAVTDSLLLTITPSPVADAGPDRSVCKTNPDANLNGSVTIATGGTWTSNGTGNFLPDADSLNVIYSPGASDLSIGGVTVTLTTTGNGSCLSVTDDALVTFTTDSVAVNAGNDTTVCADSVTLSGMVYIATGGVWTTNGSGYFSPNDSMLTANYVFSSADTAAGAISLILTTTGNGGCASKADTVTVSIAETISVNASAADTVCGNGDPVPVNALSSTTMGTWTTTGDGSFIPNDTAMSASYIPGPVDIANGIASLVFTSSNNNGCAPVKDSILINLIPAPFTDFFADSVCLFDTTTFTDATTTIGSIVSWNWDFGISGSTVTNPQHLFDTAGTYNVTLTTVSNYGCPDSITKQVIVHPNPVAEFISASQCFIDSVQFTDNSTVSSGTLSQWNWDFGDGSSPASIANPLHLFTAAGDYTISLTVFSSEGCTDTISKTINVQPAPTANFGNTIGCLNDITLFYDSSIISSGNIISWNWDFGGAVSSSQFPVYVFPSAGIFNVQLIVISDSGCTDTIVKQVTVNPKPGAAFSSSAQCFIDSVTFTNNSTGNIVNFNWNFGDGSSTSNQPDPSHYFNMAGSYTVTLIVTTDSGCTDTSTQVLTVNPAPQANFGNSTGCFNLPTFFSDSSTISSGNITSWEWDFGDTISTVPNPSLTFDSGGNFNVQLIVISDSGCTDTVIKQVTVHPGPEAGFTSSALCFVDSVFFTDTSGISTGSITQWSWDFGDGSRLSSASSPSHYYSSLGNFTVTLIVNSDQGCSDTASQSIAVAPAPDANFIMSTSTVCLDQPVLFAEISTIPSGNIVTWNWDFGDGSTSSASSVFHSFSTSDTFMVLLTVTSNLGCTDTFSMQVIAYPSPESIFFPSGFCINEGTQFNDSSVASPDTVVSWQWYYGDGNSGFSRHPIHFYPSIGTFQAYLVVTTNHGCKDTSFRVITINPAPDASFIPGADIILTGENISFTNTSFGGNSWTWDFGDSTGTSTNQNPDYIYETGGLFYVTLIAENSFECKDTAVDSVIVNIPPKVPNGFSPNGDGKNDLLFPLGGPYKEVEFKIYNNWGEVIYLSRNPSEGWDGTKNGINQPIGVYVYVLYAKTEDGKEYNMHGDVTLLR